MKKLTLIALNYAWVLSPLIAQERVSAEVPGEAPPEKAIRYLKALETRPHNEALFQRFYDAWTAEQSSEKLQSFFTSKDVLTWSEWGVLAQVQQRAGASEEAIKSITKALETAPERASFLQTRAELYVSVNAHAEAIKDLEAVVEKLEGEEALSATRLLGKSYLRVDRLEDAVTLWERSLEKGIAGVEFIEDAASEGCYPEALSLCESLISSTKDPYEKTRYSLRLGQLKLLSGDSDGALSTLAETLNQTGENSWIEEEVLREVDQVVGRNSDPTVSLAQIKSFHEKYPTRNGVTQRYARQLIYLDQWEEAETLYTGLLNQNPDDEDLRLEFITLLTMGERHETALEELELLISQGDYTETLMLRKLELLDALEKEEEIKAEITAYYERLSESQADQLKVVTLCFQYDLLEDGENLLVKAAQNPAHEVAREKLARHYISQKKEAAAAEILKELAQTENLDTLNRATGLLATIGQKEEAFSLHLAKKEDFRTDVNYLYENCQLGITAQKEADVFPQLLDIINLAENTQDIQSAVRLALNVIQRGELSEQVYEALTPPEKASHRCLLASLYMKDGKEEKAEDVLREQLSEKAPLETTHWVRLLVEKKNLEKALEVYKSLAGTPESERPTYYQNLASLLRQMEKKEEALEVITQWRAMDANDKLPWMQEISLLSDLGRPEESLILLKRAIARFSDNAELKVLLGNELAGSGSYDEALTLYWKNYDEATELTEKARWSGELFKLGQHTGKLIEVEQEFIRRKKENKKDVSPLLSLLDLEEKRQNLAMQETYLKELISLSPRDASLSLSLAEVYEGMGKAKESELAFRKAINLDKTSASKLGLTRFYLKSGKEQAALSMLKEDLEFSDPQAVEGITLDLYEADYWDSALEVLELGLAETPDALNLRYIYGSLLEDEGRISDAVKSFTHILNLPETPPATDASQNKSALQRNPYQYFGNHYYRAGQGKILAGNMDYIYARNFRGRNYGRGGILPLPNDEKDTRHFSKVHLLALLRKTIDESLKEQITRSLSNSGVEDLPIQLKLSEGLPQVILTSNSGIRKLTLETSLLDEFPDSELLHTLFMTSSSGYEIAGSLELSDYLHAQKTFPENSSIQLRSLPKILEQAENADQITSVLRAAETFLKIESEKENAHPFPLSVLRSLYHAGKKNTHYTTDHAETLMKLYKEHFNQIEDLSRYTPYRLSSITRVFLEKEDLPYIKKGLELIKKKRGQDKGSLELLNNSDLGLVTPQNSGREKIESYNTIRAAFTPHVGDVFDNISIEEETRVRVAQALLEDGIESPFEEFTLRYMAGEKEEALKALETVSEEERGYAEIIKLVYQFSHGDPEESFQQGKKLYEDAEPGSEERLWIAGYNLNHFLSTYKEEQPDSTKLVQQMLNDFTALLPKYVSNKTNLGYFARAFNPSQNSELFKKLRALGLTAPTIKVPINPTQNAQSAFPPNYSSSYRIPWSDNYRERYKRIKTYADAGEKEKALELATRLMTRYDRVNDQNTKSQCSKLIEECGLREDYYTHLEKEAHLSPDTADRALANFVFSKQQDRAEKLLSELKETSSFPSEWLETRSALFLYADGEEEQARALLASLLQQKKVSALRATPLVASYSTDFWLAWSSLVAETLMAESYQLQTATERTWFAGLCTEIINGTSSSGNIRASSLASNIESLKILHYDKRLALLLKLADYSYKDGETATVGFIIKRRLSKTGKVEGEEEDWLRAYLLTGGILNSGSNSQNSYLAKKVLDLIASSDGKTAFPADYLRELDERSPDTHRIITYFQNLSTLREEAFQKEVERLDEVWKEDITQKQYYQQNLGTLIPLDRDRLEKTLAKLSTHLKSCEDYKEQNAAETLIKQTISLAQRDLGEEDQTYFIDALCQKFKATAGDPEFNVRGTYSLLSIFSNVTRDLTAKKFLIPQFFSACYENEISLFRGHYEFTQYFSTALQEKGQERITFLKSFNLLEDVQSYAPLLYYSQKNSNTQDIFSETSERVSMMVELSSRVNSTVKKEIVDQLEEEKSQTFGTLITTAHFTSDLKQQIALTREALQKNAQDLLSLPEENFLLIMNSLPRYYKASKTEEDEGSADYQKVVRKYETLRLEGYEKRYNKVLADLEKGMKELHAESLNSLNSLKTDVQFLLTNYAPIEPEKCVALLVDYKKKSEAYLPTVTDPNARQYLQYWANNQQLIQSSVYSMSSSGDPLSGLQYMETLRQNLTLTQKQKDLIDGQLRNIFSNLDRALTKEHGNKISSPEKIEKVLAEVGEISGERLHARMLNFFAEMSWRFHKEETLPARWEEKAAESALYQSLCRLFHVKRAISSSDLSQYPLAGESLKGICGNKEISSGSRLRLASKYFSKHAQNSLEEGLADLYFQTYAEYLKNRSREDFSTDSYVLKSVTIDSPEFLPTASKFLDLWFGKYSYTSLDKISDSYLITIAKLAIMTEKQNVLSWALQKDSLKKNKDLPQAYLEKGLPIEGMGFTSGAIERVYGDGYKMMDTFLKKKNSKIRITSGTDYKKIDLILSHVADFPEKTQKFYLYGFLSEFLPLNSYKDVDKLTMANWILERDQSPFHEAAACLAELKLSYDEEDKETCARAAERLNELMREHLPMELRYNRLKNLFISYGSRIYQNQSLSDSLYEEYATYLKERKTMDDPFDRAALRLYRAIHLDALPPGKKFLTLWYETHKDKSGLILEQALLSDLARFSLTTGEEEILEWVLSKDKEALYRSPALLEAYRRGIPLPDLPESALSKVYDGDVVKRFTSYSNYLGISEEEKSFVKKMDEDLSAIETLQHKGEEFLSYGMIFNALHHASKWEKKDAPLTQSWKEKSETSLLYKNAVFLSDLLLHTEKKNVKKRQAALRGITQFLKSSEIPKENQFNLCRAFLRYVRLTEKNKVFLDYTYTLYEEILEERKKPNYNDDLNAFRILPSYVKDEAIIVSLIEIWYEKHQAISKKGYNNTLNKIILQHTKPLEDQEIYKWALER